MVRIQRPWKVWPRRIGPFLLVDEVWETGGSPIGLQSKAGDHCSFFQTRERGELLPHFSSQFDFILFWISRRRRFYSVSVCMCVIIKRILPSDVCSKTCIMRGDGRERLSGWEVVFFPFLPSFVSSLYIKLKKSHSWAKTSHSQQLSSLHRLPARRVSINGPSGCDAYVMLVLSYHLAVIQEGQAEQSFIG